MRKTPWYPASIKTVRVGLYMTNRIRDWNIGNEMLFWNGQKWYYPAGQCWAQMDEGDQWLGITKEST